MDLRVVKTKRAIKEALTELCMTKSLSDVTVKELCLRAEVSKPAFYYHYGNVGDVVDEIEDDAVSAIVEKLWTDRSTSPRRRRCAGSGSRSSTARLRRC